MKIYIFECQLSRKYSQRSKTYLIWSYHMVSLYDPLTDAKHVGKIMCANFKRERKKQSRKRRFFIWLLNVYKVSWCDWQLMCQNKMRKEKWARLCSIKTQMLDTMKVSFIYSRLSMDWSAFWSGNQSPFGCSGVTHSSISFRFIKKSSIQKTNTTPFPAWFR